LIAGDGFDFWVESNLQDWHMCELSHKGVASRAFQPSPYSPREALPAAFDRNYLEQLKK
jgi:hypothetical protein